MINEERKTLAFLQINPDVTFLGTGNTVCDLSQNFPKNDEKRESKDFHLVDLVTCSTT